MNIARLSHGPAEWRAGAFAILLLLIIPAAGCATAPSQDYRFDVVQQLVKVGGNSEIAVRLVHLPSGEAVKDAIISKGELFELKCASSRPALLELSSRAGNADENHLRIAQILATRPAPDRPDL